MRSIAFLAAAAAALALDATPAAAAPVLMSPEWAASACNAWNADPTLTGELGGKWIANDEGRGHKIVQMYRTDCGKAAVTELKLVREDGKATCVYGGAAQSTPDFDVDYLMHADTKNWKEMGAGDYGPMSGMMTGRLKFSGPYFEAMSVMGPFEAFLLLVGKVAYDADSCPR